MQKLITDRKLSLISEISLPLAVLRKIFHCSDSKKFGITYSEWPVTFYIMLSNIDQRGRRKEVHYIIDYNLRIMHIHYIRNHIKLQTKHSILHNPWLWRCLLSVNDPLANYPLGQEIWYSLNIQHYKFPLIRNTNQIKRGKQ